MRQELSFEQGSMGLNTKSAIFLRVLDELLHECEASLDPPLLRR
jgi:hypothetical protein